MEDESMQHEDLLLKLRSKLNEEKVKLWEPPFTQNDSKEITQSLQDLAKKYSTELSLSYDDILPVLHELQLHSVDQSKANQTFKETGCATLRVKVMVTGQKPTLLRIQKTLNILGSELITDVATEAAVQESRVKLIYNGKVMTAAGSLVDQGVRNGAQIMALVMAESPEEVKKEDTRYLEMKATRDDAMLLSEAVDGFDDDDYMNLEDQAGNPVALPPAEKKSLLVGLALHERGRSAAKNKDYHLALVLFLEADRQLSECRSSILTSVDNWAVVQLDTAWCMVRLRCVPDAALAAHRLRRAEDVLKACYGGGRNCGGRKGGHANERVLLMRLWLVQGIVSYYQNRRDEARDLLLRAEAEINALRVDESSVLALMELGWTRGQARAGLRAQSGKLDHAHHWLEERKRERELAREKHRQDRQKRQLGLCEDGSPVNPKLVEGLVAMGYRKPLAIVALRNANNVAADAVRLIQEQPEMLADSDISSGSETGSASPAADDKLVGELLAMGYSAEDAKTALRLTGNKIHDAVDLLVASAGRANDEEAGNPSTSAGGLVADDKKRKKLKRDRKKRERELAFDRLSAGITSKDDDHLDSSLVEEEEFLTLYKSLL